MIRHYSYYCCYHCPSESASSHPGTVQEPVSTGVRAGPLKGRPTVFALDHAPVAVDVAAVADGGRFRPARDARSQRVLRNGTPEAAVKDKVAALEEGFLVRGLFLQRAVVRHNAARQSRKVGKAQFLRQVGAHLDAADAARAVTENGRVFGCVLQAFLQHLPRVAKGFRFQRFRRLKAPDIRLVAVATIQDHHAG